MRESSRGGGVETDCFRMLTFEKLEVRGNLGIFERE